MFARLGVTEILLILGVGFLFFGPKKLPEIGKAFGDTVREFKQSAKDVTETTKEVVEITSESMEG